MDLEQPTDIDLELAERGSDRRTRRRYVFHDRRSGFDRRHDPHAGWWSRLLSALHENPRLLEISLVMLVALNLGDLVFTQVALEEGAVETNPIMAALFDNSFVWAAALKVVVSLFIVFIVLTFRKYRKMMALTVVAIAFYAGVFAYHLVASPLF